MRDYVQFNKHTHTQTGAGTEMRAVAEMATETRMGLSTGTKMELATGMRTGSRWEEERRRSPRNPSRVVDAMWEMGETWAERGKNVDEKECVQWLPTNPDNLENSKEAGGGAQDTQSLKKNCISR